MGVIVKVKASGDVHYIASTAYCICSTAANTAAKTANVVGDQADTTSTVDFTLIKGTTVHVKFLNGNTADEPTLDVSGTGAKSIVRYGTTKAGDTASTSWTEGDVIAFTYDGTNWVMNAGDRASAISPNLEGIPTAPTAQAGTNTNQIATTAFVMEAFREVDAMIFKGTIGTGGTVTTLPAVHDQGWTYRVITAGTYAGKPCEIGDLIMCIADGEVASDADWVVSQGNIDGAVIGPVSSTDSHVAAFNGASGKLIKDSGFTIAKSVPSDAQFTDTTYEFDGSYDASTNKGATVATVNDAINALDGGTIGTPGAGKTLSSLSQTNGNVSAAFQDIEITKSQVSDFPTEMTPESHTHGNIQNGGTLQTSDVAIASGDKLVVTDASDSSKVARTSVEFDGTTDTKALTQKGTWETFNNYVHPTTSGNKHIPSGGQSGQILTWDSDGTAAWDDPETIAYTGQVPITLDGRTITHDESGVITEQGVTSLSKGDTTAQTPSWGDTFKAVSATVDREGHVTALADHNVTIPNATASSSADGLMSSTDKAAVDALGNVSTLAYTVVVTF